MSGPNKKVFVIISSDSCHVCIHKIYPLLPLLKERFQNEGYDVMDYSVLNIHVNKDKNGNIVYPISLDKILWFPFMFSTDRDTWEEIKQGIDHRDKIKIINGCFDEQNSVYNFSKINNTFVNIFNIDELLKSLT